MEANHWLHLGVFKGNESNAIFISCRFTWFSGRFDKRRSVVVFNIIWELKLMVRGTTIDGWEI